MEQKQPDLSVVFPLIDRPGPGLLSARLSFCLSIYWNVGRIKITGAVGTQEGEKLRGPTQRDKRGHRRRGRAGHVTQTYRRNKDKTNTKRLLVV